MKKTLLLLSMTILMSHGYAQESAEGGEVRIAPSDQVQVGEELEKEADSGKHDKKTQRLMRKMAKGFKKTSQDIVIGVKSLDDCDDCEDMSKRKIFFRNTGRKLGKASAWLSTTTSKPFMNASGFITGVVEKKDKNKDIAGLYQFFLNHSEDFDKLYKEAATAEDLIELMLGQFAVIVENKSNIILKDFLVHLGIQRELPEDLADFEITEEELAGIDMEKVNPDFINNHPEYKELRPIIGDVTKEELEDIIISGYFDKDITFDNYKAALPKIHEAAVTIVGQVFGPKIVLGVISKTLGGLYLLPVVIADIGTGVSTAICMQSKTKEKFEKDKDLGEFCSYVVNRSAYELMKSRAKGYVAGKKFRSKLKFKKKADKA